MDYKDLIGKTIADVKKKKRIGFDDTGYLQLTFSDGTKATIVASYGDFTGDSEDEYPTGIFISGDIDESLEDLSPPTEQT